MTNMKFKCISLGCKVNSYECAALSSTLINQGYQETKGLDADVVIINTCSVTATADQKSRQHIRKIIKDHPSAICVVMGCYSQGNYEYIHNEIKPHILVGTSNRDKIPQYIEQYIKDKKSILDVEPNTRKYTYEELGVTSFSENVRAYLKIQDGCDNFCTYCLIPYRRGKMRSRAKENVLSEAKYLIEQGYPEIVLTGIHVGGYGRDLNDISFSDLVEEIANLKGLKSLRISSIEESEIDEKLIDLIAHNPVVAKHLHIPLQSGSDAILKLMNRKYTCDQFYKKIQRIKDLLPNVAITTDVIVGFPNETGKEFTETYEFIKKCGFHMLHVFPFSAREGTVAYKMSGQVNPQVKKERVSKLLDLSKQLWEQYTLRFIGQELEMLVEKVDDKGMCVGHTSNYIELEVSNKNAKPGDFINVKIEKSMIISK